MELAFDQRLIPRSVGRTEWKTIHRWVRIKRKEIAAANEEKVLALVTAPKHIRDDIIDELIYPPVILGPYQGPRRW